MPSDVAPAVDATRVDFPVHSFDCDAFELLTPAALAGYLQEAAIASADALGFGRAALVGQGLTWVLAREQVQLDHPIRFGETVTVETWPSGLDRLAALRDFRLWRGGVEVGRALTTWFVLDLATRRPGRPDRLLPPERHAQTGHVLPPAPKLPALGEAEIDRRFQVRYGDIDGNAHVTNSSYVAWALEALPEPGWRRDRLASFDVQFLAEALLGSYVRSRSAPDGAGARLHAIVREEDGVELARVRTTWVARE